MIPLCVGLLLLRTTNSHIGDSRTAHGHAYIEADSPIRVQPDALRSRGEELRRRAFDLLIAVVALVLALPVLLAIAVAIRIDSPGPILFRQTRGGINGRPFRMYKFRTMTVTENDGAITQATRGDPRITQVGRRLRQTSLDELPQLLNVIRGEMSLVGPRPHALQHDIEFGKIIDGYAAEKPGEAGHHRDGRRSMAFAVEYRRSRPSNGASTSTTSTSPTVICASIS